MMDAKHDKPEDETPLDSWKQIAAYLQRDVRTVMRWEQHEQLPIHRHQHLSRSSVYAYPRELEAWRAARRPEPEIRPLWRRPLPSAGLALGLLLALVSAGGSGRLGGIEAADRIAIRQVWSGSDVTLDGAPSPDGRYLSFMDPSNGDLAIRDLTTGQNRRLTHKEGGWDNWHEYAGSSVISPDGKQVAFAWSNLKDHGELRIVNADGSGGRLLYRTDQAYGGIEPADWSRDGKLVLALHMVEKGPDKLHRIVAVSVADGSLSFLTPLDWRSPQEMRFSPDGRFVVYDFPEESVANTDILVLSLSSGQVIPLVRHPAQDRLAGWSPDGRWVLFLSNRTGGWGMWMVPVSDGRAEGPPVAVRRDTGPIIPLGFTETGAFYYGTGDDGQNIYTSMLSGGTPTLLFNEFSGSNVGPSWSPDGEQIAYVRRGTSPRAKICIRTVSTGVERQYSPDLAGFFVPLQWSPDGRSLLVRGKGSDGRPGSYRIDVATGRVAPVLLEPQAGIPYPARWSADGKAIYYVEWSIPGSKRKSTRLVRRDLATGRDETAALPPEGISFTRFVYPSPDGRHLALWVNRAGQGCVAVVPAAGGPLRELTGPWADVQPENITWTPDSQQILFVRQEGKLTQVTRSELWGIPVEGGEPARLGFSRTGGLGRFSIHPDGKRMVFSLAEPRAREIWVMENFLPGTPSAGR